MLKMVKPDAKGRIALGRLAEGVSRFAVIETEDHRIILEPYSEIPSREKWLFDNKKAMNKFKQGLKDASKGRVSSKGSFAKFIDEE